MRVRGIVYRAVVVLLVASGRLALADAGDDQYAVAAAHYANARWQLAADEFRILLKEHADHARSANARFFLGEALVQLGQYDAALIEFGEYTSRHPDGRYARQALFRSGEAAHFTGRRDAARQALTTFRDRYRDDSLGGHALAYLGQIALDKKDFVVAEMHFAEGVKSFRQSAAIRELRYGYGRALELQQKYDQAAREYQELLDDPKADLADAASYRLGLVSYAQGKYDAAGDTLAQFDQRFPQSGLRSRARYWLGLSQKAQKNWDAAARTLIAAAENYPKEPLVPPMRHHAGDALLQAGRPREAIVQFDAAVAVAPEGDWADDAALGRLRAFVAIGDYSSFDEAVRLYETKYAASPLISAARFTSAQSLINRRRFNDAISFLQPMAEKTAKGDERTTAQYLLATAYSGQNRHAEALVLCEAAIQGTGPAAADARRLRVSCLAALSRYDEALAVLSETRGSTDDAIFQADLAVLQAASGRSTEARQTLETFNTGRPAPQLRRETLLRLAQAALRSDDVAWADELFTTLVAEGAAETIVNARIGQARCRLAKNDSAAAAAILQQVLTDHPHDSSAPDAALLRGRALEKAGDLAAAGDAYEHVVTKYAASEHAARAILSLARLRTAEGNADKALASLERLARDYPAASREDEVVYATAWAFRDAGRADEAAKRFEQLGTAKPPGKYGHDALYRVAEIALEKRDYNQASRSLAELVENKPDAELLAYAFYLQSQVAVAQTDWKQVSPPLAKLIEQCPTSPLVHAARYWQAEAAYRLEEFDEAERRFEALAQLKSEKAEDWQPMVALRRAQLLARKKKWNEAHELATAIEKEFPKFAQQYEADYLIGRCLLDQAQIGDARASLFKVVKSPAGGKTETAAMAQWMIGESYFHQERYAEAIKEYLRVEILYAFPQWQAAALLQAGKAHEKLGQTADATALYAQVLQKYGQTPHAKEAARLLRDAQQRSTARAKDK
jgi:TolA-binding protein